MGPVLWRREASGEARGCCTFNSSLAIWSVPLRERGGGAGLEKLCAPPPPLLFLCGGPGADLWSWCREGKKRSRGAHLHLITLRLLAWYKTLCKAGDPSDIRTVTPREAERDGDLFSAHHYQSSGKINKAIESYVFLLHRLTGINSLIFPSGISFTLLQGDPSPEDYFTL